MNSERQYIDLYSQCKDIIKAHSAQVMNDVRDKAYEDFVAMGLPDKKVERYKYTDMKKLFESDYGLNLKRLDIAVYRYAEAFRA